MVRGPNGAGIRTIPLNPEHPSPKGQIVNLRPFKDIQFCRDMDSGYGGVKDANYLTVCGVTSDKGRSVVRLTIEQFHGLSKPFQHH